MHDRNHGRLANTMLATSCAQRSTPASLDAAGASRHSHRAPRSSRASSSAPACSQSRPATARVPPIATWIEVACQSWPLPLAATLDGLKAIHSPSHGAFPFLVGEFGPGKSIVPSPTQLTPGFERRPHRLRQGRDRNPQSFERYPCRISVDRGDRCRRGFSGDALSWLTTLRPPPRGRKSGPACALVPSAPRSPHAGVLGRAWFRKPKRNIRLAAGREPR